MTDLPHGCRVAVIRLRSLGDCVLTTPALDLLKRARPDVRLAVVVEDRFRAIFEGNPDIDDLLAPSWRALRQWQPGLSLNLHGGNSSARLTVLSGAPQRAGFVHYRWQSLYNLHIPRAQEILGEERNVHTAEHLASAMFYLGVPRVEIPRAKLFVTTPVPQSVRPYAIIHPVASQPDKTWSAAGFLEAARLLEKDLEPVFIGAANDDLSAFQEFRTLSGLLLSQFKSIMQGASLFLGNDSGPAHMAAAFGIPAVVIFGSSDPAIWHPWRTTSTVLCGDVTVRQVLEALERMRVHA